jgi:hypothetical protein
MEFFMNKLLTITATTVLALTAGMAFARDAEPREDQPRPQYCKALHAYLKKYDAKREMPWFENLEKLYKQRCKKDGDEGHEGHEGHGDDGRE